jgi:outer membrane protein insertion porin family
VLDGEISNANFLGTGEKLTLNATHTAIGHSYSFSFAQPYWTVDGVTQTVSLFQSRVSSLTINSAPLTTASYGVTLSYDIPLSEYSAWGVSGTYGHNELFSSNGSSQAYISFMSDPNNGSVFHTVGACVDPIRGFTFICEFPALRYNTLEAALSYVHDTENRIIFPTAGTREFVSLTSAVPGSDIDYYILTYQQYAFLPLPFNFIYALNSQVSYGRPYGNTSQYPPFKNFFVGGPDSVRGWQAGTLGPKDPINTLPIGGSTMLYAQNEFVLPRFGKDTSGSGSYRLAAFIDFGNAFQDAGDFKFNQLRASWGLAATFLTPLGAMKFSYAFPMNPKPGDLTERFQFTLGAYY